MKLLIEMVVVAQDPHRERFSDYAEEEGIRYVVWKGCGLDWIGCLILEVKNCRKESWF